jgi:Phage integrase family
VGTRSSHAAETQALTGHLPCVRCASIGHPACDEVERLIDAAKGNRWGHRDATMILLAYRHGLRASELCDLRWVGPSCSIWIGACILPILAAAMSYV